MVLIYPRLPTVVTYAQLVVFLEEITSCKFCGDIRGTQLKMFRYNGRLAKNYIRFIRCSRNFVVMKFVVTKVLQHGLYGGPDKKLNFVRCIENSL